MTLPFGFDKGGQGNILPGTVDGTTLQAGVFGTPNAPNQLLIQGPDGSSVMALEEMADSPTIERGEQCTSRHTFEMSFEDGLGYIGVIGRGLLAQDSFGNLWRVLSCDLQAQRGGKCILGVTCESVSFDVPPDEFEVSTVDLGIDIIKHPRYFPNIYPTPAELGTETGAIKETLIRCLQTYRDSPFFPTTQSLAGLFNGQVQENNVGQLTNGTFVYLVPNPAYNPKAVTVSDFDPVTGNVNTGNTVHLVRNFVSSTGATDNTSGNPVTVDLASVNLALYAIMEIITKLWRMEDSPYVPAVEVKWTQYHFLPPFVNLGSYLEDPMEVVPDYFTWPGRPLDQLPPRNGFDDNTLNGDANSILDGNQDINPQDYSTSGQGGDALHISSLRKADQVEYQRTWFAITRSWVVTVIGNYDAQLYGAFKRPTGASINGGLDGQYITFS